MEGEDGGEMMGDDETEKEDDDDAMSRLEVS